jgi:hypothetical protein
VDVKWSIQHIGPLQSSSERHDSLWDQSGCVEGPSDWLIPPSNETRVSLFTHSVAFRPNSLQLLREHKFIALENRRISDGRNIGAGRGASFNKNVVFLGM